MKARRTSRSAASPRRSAHSRRVCEVRLCEHLRGPGAARGAEALFELATYPQLTSTASCSAVDIPHEMYQKGELLAAPHRGGSHREKLIRQSAANLAAASEDTPPTGRVFRFLSPVVRAAAVRPALRCGVARSDRLLGQRAGYRLDDAERAAVLRIVIPNSCVRGPPARRRSHAEHDVCPTRPRPALPCSKLEKTDGTRCA